MTKVAASATNSYHKGVVATVISGLERVDGWEVSGRSITRDKGIARSRIHSDAPALVRAATAEVGGVDQRTAVR